MGREPPRYCWHLGCILPRVPAISSRDRVEAHFNDRVAGCDTSWMMQGLQEAESACAEGWHICLDADETAVANGLTAEQCTSAPAAGTFYSTYQSSNGGWDWFERMPESSRPRMPEQTFCLPAVTPAAKMTSGDAAALAVASLRWRDTPATA